MSSAEGFDFTAQFEVLPDSVIVQYAKAIDNRQRFACPVNDFLRFEVKVGCVWDGQNDGLYPGQGCRQVVLNADIDEAILITEESGEGNSST